MYLVFKWRWINQELSITSPVINTKAETWDDSDGVVHSISQFVRIGELEKTRGWECIWNRTSLTKEMQIAGDTLPWKWIISKRQGRNRQGDKTFPYSFLASLAEKRQTATFFFLFYSFRLYFLLVDVLCILQRRSWIDVKRTLVLFRVFFLLSSPAVQRVESLTLIRLIIIHRPCSKNGWRIYSCRLVGFW
jgi:hypothetical protein